MASSSSPWRGEVVVRTRCVEYPLGNPAVAARYAAFALAQLRASVAAGLRNPEFIRRSVDLASLVENPAFRAILDDLAPELAPPPRPR